MEVFMKTLTLKKMALALGLAIIPFQVAQANIPAALTTVCALNSRTAADIALRTATALLNDPNAAPAIAGYTAGAIALSTIAGYKVSNIILQHVKKREFNKAYKATMATMLASFTAGTLSGLISFSTPITPASLAATTFLSSLQMLLWSLPTYHVAQNFW
jgi:hypothetical protein